MKHIIEINAIGLMSGTSLDGLDMACVQFKKNKSNWQFNLLYHQTISYSQTLKNELLSALNYNDEQLLKLHHKLGSLYGSETKKFIDSMNVKIDLIASHGHTIFHQPENNLTIQIGDGNQISKTTNVDTICDFRSSNVAMNGEGAPLVPIGDKLLFGEFDYCLNLGGIANISFDYSGKRVAYDISVCNMLLNYLANKIDQAYDKNGELAKRGTVLPSLLVKLDELDYYNQPYPKSLGIEWFNKYMKPLFDSSSEDISDLLHTAVIHIVHMIKNSVSSNSKKKLLVTGGGAHNKFLTEQLKHSLSLNVCIPKQEIIDYKEAIVFAFLGVLRKLNQENVLSDVTGSSHNHSAGIIYWAPNL